MLRDMAEICVGNAPIARRSRMRAGSGLEPLERAGDDPRKAVGRRQSLELLGPDPARLGDLLVGFRLMGAPARREHDDDEMPLGAIVCVARDHLAVGGDVDRLDGDRGLFLDLAPNGFDQGLARFDDSARQRVAVLRRRPRPAHHQDAAVALDDGAHRKKRPVRISAGIRSGALPRHHSTLPGLRMPLGSSACLSVRIRSSATGSFTGGRRSRLRRPMPCSAEIDPWSDVTISCTRALTAPHCARNSALSAPTGWLTLKCTLPSPRWPNGTGRQPGMSFWTAVLARSMNSGTMATGTETSCLIDPPSGRCVSLIRLRRCQNACACSMLVAIAASARRPRSAAFARRSSMLARSPARAAEESST